MISDPNRINELFEKMNANGFDTSKRDLKWGYYFVDSEKTSFYKKFIASCSDHGYKLEGINGEIEDSSDFQLSCDKN